MQNKGFTLIELLVVVLIIGILASAALPQYRAAVLKARLARLIPAVRTIKNAAETYYMANGAYPDDTSALDVGEISGCSTPGAGHIRCNDFWIDVKSGVVGRAGEAVVGFAGARVTADIPLAYAVYFDNSAFPNRIECWAHATNPAAVAACKSQGGTPAEQNLAHSQPAEMDTPINIYLLN